MDDLFYHKEVYKIPLYGNRLIVVITNNIKKIKLFQPSFNTAYIYGHSLIGDSGEFILVLNPKSYEKISAGTISHEAMHITNFIAEWAGIQPSFENDEAVAYLNTWVFDKAYNLIKKHDFLKTLKNGDSKCSKK